MQLQFRNFPELFVYTVTVPFSQWIIFICRSSIYRRPPALPPAPLSSLVPLCAMLWLFRSKSAAPLPALGKNGNFGCRPKSLEKTVFWGCRANTILEKQHFWVQSEQNPWKTTCLGAERTKPLEKQNFGHGTNKSLGQQFRAPRIWIGKLVRYTIQVKFRRAVNACSSLAPVLQHGDRENRVELRDMFFRQVRICLNIVHVFHMHSPLQAIWAKLWSTDQREGWYR